MTYKKLLSKTISINLSFLLLLQQSIIAGEIVRKKGTGTFSQIMQTL